MCIWESVWHRVDVGVNRSVAPLHLGHVEDGAGASVSDDDLLSVDHSEGVPLARCTPGGLCKRHSDEQLCV